MAALASRLTVVVALAFVIQGYYAQTTCEDPQTVCYIMASRSQAYTGYSRQSFSDSYLCGWNGWRRCRRTLYRSAAVTRYRTVYYSTFGCCSGYQRIGNTQSCEPICNDCDTNHTCIAPTRCVCPTGWTGPDCDIDIDECVVNAQLNDTQCGGARQCEQTCTNTIGSYDCSCSSDYSLADDLHNCLAMPENITFNAISSRTMILSWDPPGENLRNGTIQRYSIHCSSDDHVGFYLRQTIPVSSQSIRMTGLNPFTSYNCCIATVTTDGNGPYRCDSGITLQDVPADPPTSIVVTNTSAYSLFIEWEPPYTPNGIIVNYTIYLDYSNGTTDLRITHSNTNEYLLEGLSPHQLVGVEITANTSIGEGPRSTTEEIKTQQAAVEVVLEKGLDYLPFLDITSEGITVNVTRRDTCSNAIPISTGLRFGGTNNRLMELHICENGIITVGSSLDSSFSDNINPFPIKGSLARLIAPLWSDVDVVGTSGGRIFYQIFTEDSESDQLDRVSQFIFHQYSSRVTFTGKWMIVVEWNNVPPHSLSPGSDSMRNTYQAAVITDGGLAFAVFTYECGLLQWFRAALFSAFHSVIGINDGNGCCMSLILNTMSSLHSTACVNQDRDVDWSNRNYSLTTQNPDSPMVLTKTNRENALLGDNVTLQFAISAYPNIEKSSIQLQFQQLINATCGVGAQIGGSGLILSCTRNGSRVFVTITGVTLEIAGRYTLTAGNKVGIGTDFTDLAVQNINSNICGDLCDLARTSDPAVQATQLADITQNTTGLDAAEIAVASILLGDLSAEAVNNTQVSALYLQIIDNLLQADPDTLLTSQMQNQSSSRILFSLENFVDRVQLSNNSATATFTQTAYAFQLNDIPDPNMFTGQEFSVNLGTAAEAKTTDPSTEIDPMALTTYLNETATAYVKVPSTFIQGQSNLRLAFFVFLEDGFFQNVGENVTIGSIILGVTVPMGVEAENYNLTMGFRYTKSEGTLPDCSTFDPEGNGGLGEWSNQSCKEIPCNPGAADLEDQVCCECNAGSSQSRSPRQALSRGTHQIGHFGLLLSPQVAPLPPEFSLTLAIFSIIGAGLSLLCLMIIVVTYIASKKLRTSTPGQLLINLSLALMGIYTFFIIGGLVSGVQAICEINSALLHYFMLVYFGWTAAECINLYFKLVKVLGEVPFMSEHYVLKAGLIIWLVPLVIVAASAGAGYRFYFSNFFCRPFDWPFWFALILPVGIILVFDWIMFFVIMIALYKHIKENRRLLKAESDRSEEIKKLARYSIVLVSLMGLGWTFGLLATQYGNQNEISFIFAFIFCLIVGFQGILLLYFHGVRSSDAVAIWNMWYLKCCPCCPCGKGKKGKLSFKKSVAKKDNVYAESPTGKDRTLGKKQTVDSVPTLADSLTTSYRQLTHLTSTSSSLANLQTLGSWDSGFSGFATLSQHSWWMDDDKRDLVDWI